MKKLSFSVCCALVSALVLAESARAAAVVPAPKAMTLSGGVYSGTNAYYETDASLPAEGYRLSVSTNGVRIMSATPAGRFYAEVTLRQLRDRNGVPCVEIEDAPDYRWRGLLLDEGRHFFGKTIVKRFLDEMAQHKFNVFHWHLTEDQGWRIDIPGMPELVKYGSVRPQSVIYDTRFWRDSEGEVQANCDGERYGPYYYTRADIDEVLAYAAERHITVMPEFDIPGHIFSLLAAHPEFTCFPEHAAARIPRSVWVEEKDVLCVGNPEAIRYFERIFDYLCEVFPSKTIGIGGDEVSRKRWKACPKCQAFMKRHGMKDEGELQGWVASHFTRYLAKKGRRAIGWSEMLVSGGDVPKDAMGIVWHTGNRRGVEYGTPASLTAAGHELVMTPVEYCYLDYSQGLDLDPYPYLGGNIPLEKVYSFDPREGVPAERAQMVVGAQGNCWSEYTWSVFDLEWKTWPRGCALAEVLWTGAKRPGYADFLKRMEVHRRRLIRAHINCAPLGNRQ